MSRRSLLSTSLLVVLVLSLSLVWSGCENSADITAPGVSETQETPAFTPEVHEFVSVMRVQDRETARLMELPDVVGTATGLNDAGEPVIQILTEKATPPGRLPKQIDGIEVVEVVTGKIVAMKGKPGGGGGGGGVSHTAIQAPPIKLGTSGGWQYDLANGYCCAGTLGSLVQAGGKQYIMSNYHVLEADIVNGGNGRKATTGDPVIQPGLIDINCNANSAQQVASLSVRNALPNNNVDVAVAEVLPGMVSSEILEVGNISGSTIAAFIGQDVKKSGRTTGLTRSTVNGLNATVSVQYENECAGSAAFTKTFTGQIMIQNRRSKFLAGGDSGSLMVEDVATNPRAVGLLFAGSNTTAVANPIGEVLNFLNASMVGN